MSNSEQITMQAIMVAMYAGKLDRYLDDHFVFSQAFYVFMEAHADEVPSELLRYLLSDQSEFLKNKQDFAETFSIVFKHRIQRDQHHLILQQYLEEKKTESIGMLTRMYRFFGF
jgi:hypothetical protein